MQKRRSYVWLICLQSGYYLATALWGILDIESFMEVSGPKTDIWLVKTVSVVLLSVCICLLSGLLLAEYSLPIFILGSTSAIALAIIDFRYTSDDTIKWVYAIDGVVQVLILISWIIIWRQLIKKEAKDKSDQIIINMKT